MRALDGFNLGLAATLIVGGLTIVAISGLIGAVNRLAESMEWPVSALAPTAPAAPGPSLAAAAAAGTSATAAAASAAAANVERTGTQAVEITKDTAQKVVDIGEARVERTGDATEDARPSAMPHDVAETSPAQSIDDPMLSGTLSRTRKP